MPGIRPCGDGRYEVSGDLRFATVADLFPAVEVAGDARRVDLAGVTRSDSAGLALLLEWARQVRSRGGALHLEGASPELLSLIQIADVGGVFGLDSVDEAVPADGGVAVQ